MREKNNKEIKSENKKGRIKMSTREEKRKKRKVYKQIEKENIHLETRENEIV